MPQHRTTHCIRGHVYDETNSYFHPNGTRKCRRCHSDLHLELVRGKLYGLTTGQYQYILDAQAGRCAVCNSSPVAGRSLAVDHDHQTERVRGLLCERCNSGLAMFGDDPQLFAKAVEYLEREPLVIPDLPPLTRGPQCSRCGSSGPDADVRRRLVERRNHWLCRRCRAALGLR